MGTQGTRWGGAGWLWGVTGGPQQAGGGWADADPPPCVSVPPQRRGWRRGGWARTGRATPPRGRPRRGWPPPCACACASTHRGPAPPRWGGSRGGLGGPGALWGTWGGGLWGSIWVMVGVWGALEGSWGNGGARGGCGGSMAPGGVLGGSWACLWVMGAGLGRLQWSSGGRWERVHGVLGEVWGVLGNSGQGGGGGSGGVLGGSMGTCVSLGESVG